jgi:rod shape-determining protein MreD
MNIANLPPVVRTTLNVSIVVGSAGLCLLLLPTRFPGMEILGIGPSWLVMWTIAWSFHRSIWHAATAGIVLGLFQDAMTATAATPIGIVPTHVLSLTVVGVLAFWLHKYRYLDDTLISASIGASLLAIVNELVTGLQYFLQMATQQSIEASLDRFGAIWVTQSPVIAIAAILSGLWMPILYYPLSLWWQQTLANTKSI